MQIIMQGRGIQYFLRESQKRREVYVHSILENDNTAEVEEWNSR